MVYLGVDVGKRCHEAALLDGAEQSVWRHRLRPTRAGLHSLGTHLAALDPATVALGLEATGIYRLTLPARLSQWGAGRIAALNDRLCPEFAEHVPAGGRESALAVRTLVGHVTHRGDQIRLLGQRFDELLAPEADTRARLASTPGMGTEATRTWLAEAPPVAQVYTKDGADRLVATVGLDAQLKQSGKSAGKVKRSKRGDRYLRRALMRAAENAARTDPQYRALLERQLPRGKHYRVAVSHVARRLVHVIYSVLVHRQPYELPSTYRLGIIEPEP